MDRYGLLHQFGYLLDFLGRSFYWLNFGVTDRTVFQFQLFYLVWFTKSVAGRGTAVRGRGQALFELSVGTHNYLLCMEPALFPKARLRSLGGRTLALAFSLSCACFCDWAF